MPGTCVFRQQLFLIYFENERKEMQKYQLQCGFWNSIKVLNLVK